MWPSVLRRSEILEKKKFAPRKDMPPSSMLFQAMKRRYGTQHAKHKPPSTPAECWALVRAEGIPHDNSSALVFAGGGNGGGKGAHRGGAPASAGSANEPTGTLHLGPGGSVPGSAGSSVGSLGSFEDGLAPAGLRRLPEFTARSSLDNVQHLLPGQLSMLAPLQSVSSNVYAEAAAAAAVKQQQQNQSRHRDLLQVTGPLSGLGYDQSINRRPPMFPPGALGVGRGSPQRAVSTPVHVPRAACDLTRSVSGGSNGSGGGGSSDALVASLSNTLADKVSAAAASSAANRTTAPLRVHGSNSSNSIGGGGGGGMPQPNPSFRDLAGSSSSSSFGSSEGDLRAALAASSQGNLAADEDAASSTNSLEGQSLSRTSSDSSYAATALSGTGSPLTLRASPAMSATAYGEGTDANGATTATGAAAMGTGDEVVVAAAAATSTEDYATVTAAALAARRGVVRLPLHSFGAVVGVKLSQAMYVSRVEVVVQCSHRGTINIYTPS
jgi:hypothetical protein